jgi:hypothetical protein
LTLYEYCLGLDWGTFHVDSRRNLFYRTSPCICHRSSSTDINQFIVTATWHTAFDARKWLLLPDTGTLRDVRDFVQSTITARKDATRPRIQTFRAKVCTLYCQYFMDLNSYPSGIYDTRHATRLSLFQGLSVHRSSGGPLNLRRTGNITPTPTKVFLPWNVISHPHFQ